MKTCAILAIVALAAAPLSVNAQTLSFPRQFDCAMWPKVRDTTLAKVAVQSFLSGMSLMYWREREGKIGTPQIDPLSELSSMDQAYQWLDDYCRKNQGEGLYVGMAILFSELEAKQFARKK